MSSPRVYGMRNCVVYGVVHVRAFGISAHTRAHTQTNILGTFVRKVCVDEPHYFPVCSMPMENETKVIDGEPIYANLMTTNTEHVEASITRNEPA